MTDSDGSTGGETDSPVIVAALANPRTESALVTLAGALAKQRSGRVLAAHVVRVPDQTALSAAAEDDRLRADSERLLEAATADAAAMGVAVETRTVFSHRTIAEVFDLARRVDADAVVMGYGGTRRAGGRVEGAIDELAHDLPCDFLVFRGEELDPDRVLLPTAGGYSSDLSAAVARALRDTLGSALSVLYVAEDGDADAGRRFVTDWTAERGLGDADVIVETGDVEAAIERGAADHSLVVIGATERGLLSRVVGGSLTLSVLDELDTPVLVAERPSDRSLRERLFGRR
jgi:nucleotide-binding universal stress UspA family protein